MAIGKKFDPLTPNYIPITPGEISKAFLIANQLPLSAEGRDLAMILLESGFEFYDLTDLSENQLRDLYIEVYGGKYTGGTGKNIEILRYQKAMQDASEGKRAWPSPDLNPTS